MLLGLLTIFLGLLVFLWVKLTSKPKNFPPGPSRLPIVGSVLDLKSPHSSTPSILWGIVKFEKIYGEVIGLYLGYMRTVALTNYEDIKEIMNMEETASRPPAIPCQIRPGWEIPQQTDPIMNKDRAPGVILSNVSTYNLHAFVKRALKKPCFFLAPVLSLCLEFSFSLISREIIGENKGDTHSEICEILVSENPPWKVPLTKKFQK